MSTSTSLTDSRNPDLAKLWPGRAEEIGDGCAFVAASPTIAGIQAQIEQVAGLDVPVLLLGESGVGKDVAARLIHKLSPRAHRMFLKINCAALPAELLESELFGYEAGAFTGATRAKPGKFELCNKGTIFLDEIGEMPAGMQAKLLQVLEDRQFSRLGGRSLVTVDARILAATNVNIEHALATGRFRHDLYYRLSAFPLRLPPLRERQEEIVPLLEYFLHRVSARMGRSPKPFLPSIIEACLRYHWPGNIRELENFVKRYLILGDGQAALCELVGGNGNGNGTFHAVAPIDFSGHHHLIDLKSMVRELKAKAEKQAIQRVLEQTKSNRKEAARSLGISTKALLHKMRQYGISPTNAPDTKSAEQTSGGTIVPSRG